MPVFLSLLVCVAAHTTACHVTVPTQRPLAGIAACGKEGMEQAAAFVESHPGWVVKRIRCSIGNRPAQEDAA